MTIWVVRQIVMGTRTLKITLSATYVPIWQIEHIDSVNHKTISCIGMTL